MASTLTVSIAVMHAGASVTAELPAASIEYIELSADALVDNSGRFQYKTSIVLVVDSASKQTTKPFSDSVALTDAKALSFSKSLAHSVEMQDAAQTLLIYVRVLAETQSLSDALILESLKAVDDSAPAMDANLKSFSKALADAVGMNDGTSIGDGSTYSFTKSVNNITSVADAYGHATSKPIAETLSLSEAGIVSVQGYCDITYFAEDYVGTSSSF